MIRKCVTQKFNNKLYEKIYKQNIIYLKKKKNNMDYKFEQLRFEDSVFRPV